MVTLRVRKLHGFLSKTKGLLFSKIPDYIYFTTRFGIHTFGVRFPIDVVILDSKNTIVKLKQNLKPNRVFFWNPKYEHVLELPVHTTKHITVGDKIEMVFES